MNKLFTGNPEDLADAVQFGVKIAIAPSESRSASKLLTLGLPLGARFELGSGDVAIGVEKLDALKIFAEADLIGGVFAFGTGSADGFVSNVVPLDDVRAEFSLGVGVSNLAGLYFKGSSGLTLRLPLHLQLGPIGIEHITLGAEFREDSLPITAATGLSIKLGPIAGAIEDIGVRAILTPSPDRTGNLGPHRRPLRVQAAQRRRARDRRGVVKRRRLPVLRHRPRGVRRRAGARASRAGCGSRRSGSITTRMPDGSHGFSLLIIITAEFGAGIQLGFGFTLIGVGGLLGLNRTMRLAAAHGGRPDRRDQQRSCSRATSSPTRRGSSATCARSSRRRRARS